MNLSNWFCANPSVKFLYVTFYFKDSAKPAAVTKKGSEVSVKKGTAAVSKKKDNSDSESSDEDDSSSDEEPVSIICLVESVYF